MKKRKNQKNTFNILWYIITTLLVMSVFIYDIITFDIFDDRTIAGRKGDRAALFSIILIFTYSIKIIIETVVNCIRTKQSILKQIVTNKENNWYIAMSILIGVLALLFRREYDVKLIISCSIIVMFVVKKAFDFIIEFKKTKH